MEVLTKKLNRLDKNWIDSLSSSKETTQSESALNKHNDNSNDALLSDATIEEQSKILQGLSKTNKLVETILYNLNLFKNENMDFITNIDDLSIELNHIKHKSEELNKQSLQNKTQLKTLDQEIAKFKFLSPELIDNIMHHNMNSQWCDNAMEVLSFLKNLDSQEEGDKQEEEISAEEGEGQTQLHSILEILKYVILERCKKTIVDSIKRLRTFYPSQVEQKKLLGIKPIFQILQMERNDLAHQLFEAYCNTMRWYYTQFFTRYIRSLSIMQYHAIDINYKFNGQLSYYYSMLTGVTGGAVSVLSVDEYFQSVNKRIFILSQENNTVMVSQIAETNTMKNYLEIGFKNLNLCILNNYQVEEQFIEDFFNFNEKTSTQITDSNENGTDRRDIKKKMKHIFENVFETSIEFTKTLTATTYDFYGILLCIRISQIYIDRQQTWNNEISSLENTEETTRDIINKSPDPFEEYLNGQLLETLWPKFQNIINNVNNVTDISQVQPDQFVSFLQGILILSSQYNIKVEPLYQSLMNILNNFETFNLQKTHAGNKTYQINVYNKILNLLDLLEQRANETSSNNDKTVDEDDSIIEELKKRYITCIKNAK